MVLVTGGTGLVGSHLLLALCEKGVNPRAIYRSTKGHDKVRKLFAYFGKEALYSNIEWIQADLMDLVSLEKAFRGVTQCYHCAALISFDPSHYKSLRKVNIEGTANIVNTAISSGTSRLCYLSSIATLGSAPKGTLISENDFWNPAEDHNPYAITKYGAEMEVWRGTQEGLDALIFNPGVILGESEDPNSSTFKIMTQARKQTGYYPIGGTGFTDVRDLAAIMVKAMDSSVVNERFIVVNSSTTYKEVLSGICNCLGCRPPEKPLQRWMLKMLLFLDMAAGVLPGYQRRLTPHTVRSLSRIKSYDSTKLQTTYEVELNPIDRTIARICPFFKDSLLP